MHKNATFQMRPNAIKCSMLRMHHVTNAQRWSGLWECIIMRQNASYPKCSRSENALKCTQRENEECSCRECKQRGSRMHENATNSRMQHEWNALKCVQMYCNAQKCMRMRYVRNYTDLRKKLHHTLVFSSSSLSEISSRSVEDASAALASSGTPHHLAYSRAAFS